MSFFAKIFNAWIYKPYGKLLVQANKLWPRKSCYNCGNKFHHFTKFRGGFKNLHPWIMNLDFVGSDIDNFGCMYCGANDRVRHLLMFFDKLNLWQEFKNAEILHFAPESILMLRIKQQNPLKYLTADLFPENGEIQKIDITAIPFANSSFDILIANHVLEHVPDYEEALNEIYRILKTGGFAVLQTPYSRLLHNNFEDQSINTDELRLLYYGQEDHVRWFSEKQLLKSMTKAGFTLNFVKHSDLFETASTDYYGVNAAEVLMLVRKEN